MTFTNSILNTCDVKSWVIGNGSTLTGLKENDFTGDSLDFHGVAGDTLMTGEENSFFGLEAANKEDVYINGYKCAYTEGSWVSTGSGLKLVVDGNSLKLASLAS